MSTNHDLTVVARLRDDLSGPLERPKRAVRELGREVQRTSRETTAATRSTGGLGRAVNDLSGGLNRATNSVGRFVAHGLLRVTQGLGVATVAAGVFGIKAASNFEQSRIAFQTLLGSVSQGNRMFSDLQKLNLKTPFDLNQLTTSAQLLLRYGIAGKDLVGTLTPLIDAAALSGPMASENLERMALAVGQIASNGRLMGQDARQLLEAGIPIYQVLAEKLGITAGQARKLGEEGKISSDIVLEAIRNYEGGLSKFRGGAEKESQTLLGMLSNFRDALNVRLADAAKPLVDGLKQALPKLTELIGGTLDRLGPPLIKLAMPLIDLLTGALPILEPVLTGLAKGVAAIAGPLAQGLKDAGPAFAELGPALADLGAALAPLAPVLADLLIALAPVLVQLIRLSTSFVIAVTPALSAFARVLERFTRDPDRARLMAGAIVALVVAIKGFRALQGMAKLIDETAGAIRGLNAANAAGTGPGGFSAGSRTAAAIAGAIPFAGWTAQEVTNHRKASGASILAGGATGALAGATIGSVVPGIGTGIGALVGGGIGLIVGGADRLRSKHGDPSGALSAAHGLGLGRPGGPTVTSNVRGYGLASPWSTGHPNGTAFDITGSGSATAGDRARRMGAFVANEGTHRHIDFGDAIAPARAGAMAGGGGGIGPVIVNVHNPSRTVDVTEGVDRALRRVEDRRAARHYRRRRF